MAWNEPGGGNNSNNQDPWGGGNRGGGDNRGGNQGRPDLEEGVRKQQDRLIGIFSKKKCGGSGGNARRVGGGQGITRGVWIIGGVLMFVFWLFNAIYMVDDQEQAVILRLGEYNSTVES